MYRLIAFDMDGTLLNSQKKIAAESVAAIQDAVSAGKEVVLSTGRALAQIKEYREDLKALRFAVLANGALICDLKNDKILLKKPLSKDLTDTVLELIAGKNIMIVGMADGQVYLQKSHYQHIHQYHMQVYQKLYQVAATFVDDIREVLKNKSGSFEKIELFHESPAERDLSYDRLQADDIVKIKSEKTGIEITALGAEKGKGLEFLCDYLQVPISETIAVGDSANDEGLLRQAGLGIAMGNASQPIQDLADEIVADHDQDGCAQAIYQYLL